MNSLEKLEWEEEEDSLTDPIKFAVIGVGYWR